MFKPIVQYLEPNFRQTHQDIYLELGNTQYRYQALAVLETTVESSVYRYTDLSDPAAESDFRSTLFDTANLDVIHHTKGYLTLSTCGDWGGGHQGAGGGKSGRGGGGVNPYSAFVSWDTS